MNRALRAVVGGMAGGLAASFAMGMAHQAAAKRMGVRGKAQDPTARVASELTKAVSGRELTAVQKSLGGQMVHYGFGTVVGGVYGAAVVVAPAVTAGCGVPFGLAVWAGAHATAVPALGLADPVMDAPLAEEAIEFISHLVYGAVAEGVRRAVTSTLS